MSWNACWVWALVLVGCGARTAPLVGEEGRDASIARCRPSAERCNGVDDDCDGATDEGLALTSLGDPVVLRSPGETSTGTCRVCDQALRADVGELEDGGLFVLWQMNFVSAEPRTNTFARRLDASGAPVEAAWPWTDRFTTLALELVPLPDGRRVLAFCDRIHVADINDYPSIWLVDGEGRALGDFMRVSERPSRVGAVRAASTDARLLMTLLHESPDAELVAVAPDLRPEPPVVLGYASGIAIAARSTDALVMRWIERYSGSEWSTEWSAHRFDGLGRAQGSSSFISRSRPSGFALLPRPDGYWFALADGDSVARLRALTPEGVPTGEPRLFGGANGYSVDPISLPDGGLVVVVRFIDGGRGDRREWSELYVTDSAGEVTQRWSSEDLGEPAWRTPTLRLVRGRVAIVYTTDAPSTEHNEVRLRLLSCR